MKSRKRGQEISLYGDIAWFYRPDFGVGRRCRYRLWRWFGLRREARDDTAAQVNRVLLTLVGTAVFCPLSLLTPDSSLLVGSDKLNVPLTGPVSFAGFMVLGRAVLIVLRVYLQIYAEHERRLDRVARISGVRTLTLIPAKNPLLRIFRGFAFYLLLPLTMLSFFWKGAVFATWGASLLTVVAGVVVMHLTLLVRRLSWNFRIILSASAMLLTNEVMRGFEWNRPFDLRNANLSDQHFVFLRLNHAHLDYANLARTNLSFAYLNGADLGNATLNGADLTRAELDGSKGLTQQQLDTACGDVTKTRLPPGLKILRMCH
jgi:hypothetical protein